VWGSKQYAGQNRRQLPVINRVALKSTFTQLQEYCAKIICTQPPSPQTSVSIYVLKLDTIKSAELLNFVSSMPHCFLKNIKGLAFSDSLIEIVAID
jgi:predicted phosphoribosyltransferase